MTSNENDEPEYGLVMPFVNVESRGGEYQDRSYVAGYEMGCLEGQLIGNVSPTPENPGPGAVGDWRWMRKGNVDQLDLIAMKHGYQVQYGDPFEDLVSIRLVRPAVADPS